MTNTHCLGLDSWAAALEKGVAQDYRLDLVFKDDADLETVRSVERMCVYFQTDLAMLEVSGARLVEGEDYVIVPRKKKVLDTLGIRPGEDVIAVGTPHEESLSGTQTFGKISALRDDPELGRVIQHDASAFGGNSGGPLFLRRGKDHFLVGVNTKVLRGTSMTFAISVDELDRGDSVWVEANVAGIQKLVSTLAGK